MSPAPERQLARLRARFEQHAQELARLGFLLKGSLLQRFKQCSSSGCACHADPPQLHGPYWQWTSKVNGKTITRTLSEDQVSRYREWMENGRRFDQIVQDLYDLSAQADAILRSQERQSREPRENAPRRRTRSRA
jgi:hypothetical protein